jgi:hypothetical protein
MTRKPLLPPPRDLAGRDLSGIGIGEGELAGESRGVSRAQTDEVDAAAGCGLEVTAAGGGPCGHGGSSGRELPVTVGARGPAFAIDIEGNGATVTAKHEPEADRQPPRFSHTDGGQRLWQLLHGAGHLPQPSLGPDELTAVGEGLSDPDRRPFVGDVLLLLPAGGAVHGRHQAGDDGDGGPGAWCAVCGGPVQRQLLPVHSGLPEAAVVGCGPCGEQFLEGGVCGVRRGGDGHQKALPAAAAFTLWVCSAG